MSPVFILSDLEMVTTRPSTRRQTAIRTERKAIEDKQGKLGQHLMDLPEELLTHVLSFVAHDPRHANTNVPQAKGLRRVNRSFRKAVDNVINESAADSKIANAMRSNRIRRGERRGRDFRGTTMDFTKLKMGDIVPVNGRYAQVVQGQHPLGTGIHVGPTYPSSKAILHPGLQRGDIRGGVSFVMDPSQHRLQGFHMSHNPQVMYWTGISPANQQAHALPREATATYMYRDDAPPGSGIKTAFQRRARKARRA